jgi:asparagine synthetase B (glutamine-hydrolysing)
MMQAMIVALAHRGPDDHGIEIRQARSAVVGLRTEERWLTV